MSISYSLYKIIPSRKIRTIILNHLRYKQGGATSSLLREIFYKEHGIICGYGSYGGCFDYSNIPNNVIFGNYCSIASGVKIFRTNHPINLFTTHPMFYNPIFGYVKDDKLIRPQLTVGHDVWIGANVIITPGCKKIGNGAIIGAGSIITKDVDAYSIVVGNPGIEKKKRFNSAQIEFLENSKWWNLNMAELAKEFNNLSNKINELARR